jgi:hypothetical protein
MHLKGSLYNPLPLGERTTRQLVVALTGCRVAAITGGVPAEFTGCDVTVMDVRARGHQETYGPGWPS